MTVKNRLTFISMILAVISFVVIGMTLSILYNTSFEQQRARLVDTAKSHALLIHAIARSNFENAPNLLDENPEFDAYEATLTQLRRAHENLETLGETGEFTLARLDGERIEFILSRRYYTSDVLLPANLPLNLAEPMRRALRNESGASVELDYRGVKVLAAYEPVKDLNLGIVAKIDLSEIRAPFIRVGLILIGLTFLLTIVGFFLFFRIGNPVIYDLNNKEAQLKDITSTIPGCIYQFVFHKDGSISIPYFSDALDNILGMKTEILTHD
ncbi:MAG: hypothetical protein ABIJ12_04400, partial [bacterium]